MANTYTQIHLHIVIVVKYRAALIAQEWKDELHKYITGVVQNNGHKMICINSMPDHLHMLIGMRPAQSLSDLMRLVKGDSSEWINKKGVCKQTFRWQEGYGAFSYAKSQLSNVCRYIENQEKHHAKTTFQQEYLKMLKAFEVEYDEKYLFVVPV